LAPADGTVVRIENGFDDNTPGTPSQDSPQGNMIVILHGNKEFSVLDHLKQNSIIPKKGDTVKQGDPIAACGNSGNSPAPHIHYQLRNSAGMPPPEPLAAQFHDYIADGKPVAVGEPVKGQTVSNAPMTAGTQPDATPEPKTEPVKK
jgi:murein DD-endopeptidase MepM/ murein hydrolase activator NlpD